MDDRMIAVAGIVLTTLVGILGWLGMRLRHSQESQRSLRSQRSEALSMAGEIDTIARGIAASISAAMRVVRDNAQLTGGLGGSRQKVKEAQLNAFVTRADEAAADARLILKSPDALGSDRDLDSRLERLNISRVVVLGIKAEAAECIAGVHRDNETYRKLPKLH
ncbi:MAG: hypothetical protein Q8R01_13455 [Ramlibacter sp.]|nr:hypothetical protein [Ramlibacter sp.]